MESAPHFCGHIEEPRSCLYEAPGDINASEFDIVGADGLSGANARPMVAPPYLGTIAASGLRPLEHLVRLRRIPVLTALRGADVGQELADFGLEPV